MLDLHDTFLGGPDVIVPSETGHYGGLLWQEKAEQLISDFARDGHLQSPGAGPGPSVGPAAPRLFLYVAMQDAHAPLQAPQSFIDRCRYVCDAQRRSLCAQVALADEATHNLTEALRQNMMWDDTILVFANDNGGPVCNGRPRTDGGECGADIGYAGSRNGGGGGGGGVASNWPLRGSKHSVWEGGVRGNSFVAGGALHPVLAGTNYEGLMHLMDWHAVFVRLSSVAMESANQPTLPSKALDAIDLLDDIAAGARGAASHAHHHQTRSEALLNLDGDLVALVAEQQSSNGTALGLWKFVRGERDAGHTRLPTIHTVGCAGYTAGEQVGGREACAVLDDRRVCGLHLYCLRGCPPGVEDDSVEERNLAAEPRWQAVVGDLMRRVEAIQQSGDTLAPEPRGSGSGAAIGAAHEAGGWTPWM